MTIRQRLFNLSDKKYALFQAKLTPTISPESIIGVRIPVLRKLAKELIKNEKEKVDIFLKDLPHEYYDENLLHGLILSEIKDYDECVNAVDKFLPFVDNWAVCDTMSPKVFKKNKEKLIAKIYEWSVSHDTYTCRFGIEMLMSHFLDDGFKAEYLELPAKVDSDEYYIKMMVAWFFATALAKRWDESVIYIEQRRLETWTHNKTIQKARESFRISDEQKAYLKTLKV